MLGMSQTAGHELTNDAASADVLVVNTCAFINSAKQESIDAILEMAQLKKDGNCSRLVVTGCLGERYRAELQKEIPEIDAVLGTGDIERILDAIGEPALGPPGARPGAGVVAPLAFHRSASGLGTRQHEIPAPRPEPRVPELPTYLYDADTPRVLTTPK